MARKASDSSSATMTEEVPQLSTRHLTMIAAALSLLIFSATLSGTIISTATKSITKSFGLNNVSWVAQSFLIISTALQPGWGKLSDIFGCRPPLLIGVVTLLAFSAMAGFSVNMLMLIVARGLMGVGASASLAMVNIIISEIVPIRKRGMYMGIISAANGVGQVIGPLLGGIISDKLSWRWTMFINIPLILTAAVPLFFLVKLPNPPGSLLHKFKSVDFKGIAILLIAITCLLLGLDFGSKGSWTVPKTYTLLAVGILLICVFLIVEHKTKRDPIVDLGLFKYRNVSLNLLGAVVTGFVMYVGIFFIPEFFTAVYNVSPTNAGVKTWPWMMCVILASVGCGIAITRFGVYRPYLWSGSTLLTVGFGLMYSLNHEQGFTKHAIYIAIIGLGIGFRMPSSTISAQAAVTKEELAQTTALLNFFRSMGGILGLSISKALQTSIFDSKMGQLVLNNPEFQDKINDIVGGSISEIHNISSESVRLQVLVDYVNSLRIVFIMCVAIGVVGLIATFFIKHIHLNSEEEELSKTKDELF